MAFLVDVNNLTSGVTKQCHHDANKKKKQTNERYPPCQKNSCLHYANVRTFCSVQITNELIKNIINGITSQSYPLRKTKESNSAKTDK